MTDARTGGPEECPRRCCLGEHHFSDAAIGAAETEPNHDAAKAGVERWYQCKHCPAWREYGGAVCDSADARPTRGLVELGDLLRRARRGDPHPHVELAQESVYAAADGKPEPATDPRAAIAGLLEVATFRTPHLWNGDCPEDGLPEARDPGCLACQAIARAEEALRAPALDPVGALLDTFDADLRDVDPALSYTEGPLNGVLVADYVRCVSNLVRMRAGRETK